MDNYQQCKRCVMDTSDSLIEFNEKGYCNHCTAYLDQKPKLIKSGNEGVLELDNLIAKVKKASRRKKYDVILGLSGGMDSSFVAYNAKKYNLRILAVHLDNGWNSEISVNNIENCVSYLNADLYTHVIDWNEFRNLQIAYLKAGVIDIEAITDHAIRSIILKISAKYGIEYSLSGNNFATEGILPQSWVYNKNDFRNIKSINSMFGKKSLNTFPGMSLLKFAYYRKFANIKSINLLNYINYNIEDARENMEKNMGWKYYGGKHQESIFTKFYQGYILPKKFGVDKRIAHLSSMICSGNITRDEALKILSKNFYNEDELANDMEYVLKKLKLKESTFQEIMNSKPISHLSYKNNDKFFKFLKRFD